MTFLPYSHELLLSWMAWISWMALLHVLLTYSIQWHCSWRQLAISCLEFPFFSTIFLWVQSFSLDHIGWRTLFCVDVCIYFPNNEWADRSYTTSFPGCLQLPPQMIFCFRWWIFFPPPNIWVELISDTYVICQSMWWKWWILPFFYV